MGQQRTQAERTSGHLDWLPTRWKKLSFYGLPVTVLGTWVIWRFVYLGISGVWPDLKTLDEGSFMSLVGAVLLLIVYGIMPTGIYLQVSQTVLALVWSGWIGAGSMGLLFGAAGRYYGWQDPSGKAQVAAILGAIAGTIAVVWAQAYDEYLTRERKAGRDPHQWVRRLRDTVFWSVAVIIGFIVLLAMASNPGIGT